MTNLIKPYKLNIRPKYGTFDIMCISIIASLAAVVISLVSLIFTGIPSSDEIVTPTLLGVPLVVFLISALYLRFNHLPYKIKEHFAYNKQVKEYNATINRTNTNNFITICRGRSHE